MDNTDNRVMTPHIYKITDREVSMVRNPFLIFVFEGEMELEVDGNTYPLHAEDFMAVNFMRPCRFLRKKSGLIGILEANHDILKQYVDLYENDFECYSPALADEHRKRLRWLIYQVFNNYYQKEGLDQLLLNAHCYQLLYRMCQRCLVGKNSLLPTGENTGDDVLIARIMDYIKSNYNRKISLADLSEITFFSTAYLSKYIKKKTKHNFMEILVGVRLSRAMGDIRNTNHTIMKIAMDNGFPNTVSFNKAFREAYNMTPSHYQKQVREEQNTEAPQEENDQVQEKVIGFLKTHEEQYDLERRTARIVRGSVEKAVPCRNSANRMINGGLAKDLLRADMQNHLKILHEELGFEYVRFWDIYAPELFLHADDTQGEYNFTKLDVIIDFLLDNGMRPYIELGFKPILLISNIRSPLYESKREPPFRSNGEYADFIQQLIKHYLNRYGAEQVEQWYFEQWRDERYENLSDYFEVFEAAFKEIKCLASGIRVGGGGFNRDQYQSFEEIIAAWKARGSFPDFISLYSYPFKRDAEVTPGQVARDPDYMKNYLEYAHAILEKYGYRNEEIHLTEWNFTIASRDNINDSIFKGAYIVRNMIENMDKASLMGYWLGSDLFSEFYDTTHILEGSGGLLTKDGIRKPAYFGFEFMNRCGKYLLGREESSIITSNLHDSYEILCTNYSHPNYKYYVKVENDIDVSDLKGCFDGENARYEFTISGVRNGTYTIKIRRVNEDYGSVQDEWIRMGLSDNLSKQDISYLRQTSVPKISIETIEVTDNQLRIETMLRVNEIQQIHATYQFK